MGPRLVAMVVLLALGCQRDQDDTGLQGDPASIPLRGACDMEHDLGGFVVEVYQDYSIVGGKVSDGVVPITVLDEVGAEGDCRALQRTNPWCDPPCGFGDTCDFSGECIPYPETQDLGTVTIAGLVSPVEMEPVAPGATYFDTSIDHPAFEADRLIRLDTTGGRWDPVRLYGVGVEPLAVDQELLLLKSAEALQLTWTAPTGLERSTVELVVNIDQHGNTPVTIQCTFDDDGHGEIPGDLVELLVRAGVTGFPSGSLRRRTTDSVPLDDDGCMDFIVSSPRSPDVRVDGFIPCHDRDDCPDGQDCDLAIQLCE